MNCPFCDYSDWDRVLADYGPTLIISPLNPVTDGHVLATPRRHVVDWLADPHETAETVTNAMRFAKNNGIGDCNLITSRGPAATQSVGHLHFHVVPRHLDDGLQLPWSRQEESR